MRFKFRVKMLQNEIKHQLKEEEWGVSWNSPQDCGREETITYTKDLYKKYNEFDIFTITKDPLPVWLIRNDYNNLKWIITILIAITALIK
jgi:hypothetical protein